MAPKAPLGPPPGEFSSPPPGLPPPDEPIPETAKAAAEAAPQPEHVSISQAAPQPQHVTTATSDDFDSWRKIQFLEFLMYAKTASSDEGGYTKIIYRYFEVESLEVELASLWRPSFERTLPIAPGWCRWLMTEAPPSSSSSSSDEAPLSHLEIAFRALKQEELYKPGYKPGEKPPAQVMPILFESRDRPGTENRSSYVDYIKVNETYEKFTERISKESKVPIYRASHLLQ